MKIGMIGLGKFGFPIAINILRKNELFLFPEIGKSLISIEKLYEKGAKKSSLSEINLLDALILCLPKTKDVKDIIQSIPNVPNTIIDLTTGNPNESLDIENYLKSKKIIYIAAPVSGSIQNAMDGNLTVFVGKEKQNISDKVIEIVEEIGNPFYFKNSKLSNTVKSLNQFIHISNVAIMGAAFNNVDISELDKNTLLESLKSASSSSKMMERFGESILDREYETMFSLKNAKKDIDIFSEISNENEYLLYLKRMLNDKALEGKEELNFTIITEK